MPVAQDNPMSDLTVTNANSKQPRVSARGFVVPGEQP